MTKKMVKHMENNHYPSKIFLSIDHLKTGDYQLNIMCKNEVIKTLKFQKS